MELVKLDKGFKDELLEVWKIAFEEDEGFNDELCGHFFNHENLWECAYGWIDNNKLVSTYLTLDVDVLIRNKEFKGHYIDGLATLPSHQRRGLINEQMLKDAKYCFKNNIPLMLVDPSRDSFYRKFGFEFAIDKHRIVLDKNFCSREDYKPKYIVKADIIAENSELQQAYKDMNEWLFKNSSYNEMKWPECYEDIKFKRRDMTIAVAFGKSNKVCGYMLYSREGNNVRITSFRYRDLNAFYGLKEYMLSLDENIESFSFLSIPQDFPIDLMLKDLGRPEKKLYFGSWISRMIRIIDFKGFLEGVIEKAPKSPICIHIKDHIIAENEAFYTILPCGEVKKESSGKSDVTTTITDIVPLLTGLKSARELYYYGKLKVSENESVEQFQPVAEVIKQIDEILPKVTTYSADEYLAP
ncbi:MAG: GNAT family N-acetyltransferase [Dethiosulfatibacter sp.]|nr:GNAT family N-acetyltransferase [Dethiosulfatibacter sp.]